MPPQNPTPLDPQAVLPESGDDDTPATPFSRRAPRPQHRPRLTLPPELEARTTLGDYELSGLIGQGGMAWIFHARKKTGGVPVALKVLDPDLLRQSGAAEHVERFFREARVAQRLEHPNIVGAVDQGTCPESKCHYIAFELVDGQTVEDLLAIRGRLPQEEALAIVFGVAQALAYIEGHGIVHRDIKPTNILVDTKGTARLADLGMAKVVAEAGLTQSGAVLGTPHYIAPEQAIGDQVDIRADLYALGITLFRLVTGQLPFEGDAFLDVVTKHVNEDVPDPRQMAPDVTQGVAQLIAGLCARDPAERYPTAKAAAEDVARALLGQAPEGPGTAPATVGGDPKTSRWTDVQGRAYPRGLEATPLRGGQVPPALDPTPRAPVTSPGYGPRVAPDPAAARSQAAAQAAAHKQKTPPPRPAVPPTLKVTVSTGKSTITKKKFDQDVIRIGRDPKSDIHIDNPMVSRHHAEIRRRGGSFEVTDNETTNGTYLNGERVKRATPITSGDVVGVTKKFNVVCLWDGAAAPPPAQPVEHGDTTGTTDPVPGDSAALAAEPQEESKYDATPLPPQPAEAALSEATTTQPTPAPTRVFAEFTRNGTAERHEVLEGFQVGKSPECDVRLEGAYAPRKAWLLVRTPTALRLYNVAPYPQTVLVNGEPVEDHAPLKDGDCVAAYGLEVTIKLS